MSGGRLSDDMANQQSIEWRDGEIHDSPITPLKKYPDDRGWLAEFFRHDEVGSESYPVMGYISMTKSGVARGPHEHRDQSDLFVFFNGTFRLYLWDTCVPRGARKYETCQQEAGRSLFDWNDFEPV